MYRLIISLIVVELISFMILYAGTRGIVEGRIVDKETTEELAGVVVQIIGSTIGTTSNAEGYYQLFNIQNGVYEIKISALGHKPIIVKDVIVKADMRVRLDIEMEQSAVELAPVEIYSHKSLIQKDQPATMFSINSIKLEKLPVQSFHEVLLLQPGVTLEGNVRGGKINEVMYYVDGFMAQDNISGGLGVELPKSAIDDMMIYTSGFDAEYGNAMSGVVNVVTKGGGNNHRLIFRFEKDNWLPSNVSQQVDQLTEGEFQISGPLIHDKLFYFNATTVRVHNTRWWQDMNNFFSSPNNKGVSGISKIDYLFSNTSRLTLQGIYSDHTWHDYEFSWRYNLNGLPERSKMSMRGSVIYNNALSDHSAFSVSASTFYLRNNVGDVNNKEITLVPYQFDYYLRYIVSGEKNWWSQAEQFVNTVKADYHASFDKLHLVKAGGEINFYDLNSSLVKYEPQRTYFGKTLENEPLLNYSNTYKYSPRTGNIFFQDKMRFELDGSTLSLGIRWDFLDPRANRPIVEYIPNTNNEFQQQIKGFQKTTFKHQFSPRVAFAAPIGTENIIFANFGKYFQYPLFDYLYSGIDPAKILFGAKNVLVGNPDLEPEETTSWEIGYKQSIDEYYVGSITYFRKNIKNQIDAKTLIPFDSKWAGDYGFAQYINNADAYAEGLEAIITWEGDRMFTGAISYTYMITEGTSEIASQAINLAQWGFPTKVATFPLSWDQRHTIKIDLEAKLIYDIILDGIIWYNSPKPYTFFPTRDGFTTIDSTKDFLPNNSRMSSIVFMNLKLSKNIKTENDRYSFSLYADIRNLFNNKNVKWIDSNGRIGGELSDPSAYYDPRRVRVGIVFDF